MEGKFDLTLTLGNDAMASARDVAHALRAVAAKLDAGKTRGKVLDANGNSCGAFRLALDGEE